MPLTFHPDHITLPVDVTEDNIGRRTGELQTYIQTTRTRLTNLKSELFALLDRTTADRSHAFNVGHVCQNIAGQGSSDEFLQHVDYDQPPSLFLERAYTVQSSFLVSDGTAVTSNRYQHYIAAGTAFLEHCKHPSQTTPAQKLLQGAADLTGAINGLISGLNRLEATLNGTLRIQGSRDAEQQPLTDEDRFLPFSSLTYWVTTLTEASEQALLLMASEKQIKNIVRERGRSWKWMRENPGASHDQLLCLMFLARDKQRYETHHAGLSNKTFVSNLSLLLRDKLNIPLLERLAKEKNSVDFARTIAQGITTQLAAGSSSSASSSSNTNTLTIDGTLRDAVFILQKHGVPTKNMPLNRLSKRCCQALRDLDRVLGEARMPNVLTGVVRYFNGELTIEECLERLLPGQDASENEHAMAARLMPELYAILSVAQWANSLNESGVQRSTAAIAWLREATRILASQDPLTAVYREVFQASTATPLPRNEGLQETLRDLLSLRRIGFGPDVASLMQLSENPGLCHSILSLSEPDKNRLIAMAEESRRHDTCHLLAQTTTNGELDFVITAMSMPDPHTYMAEQVDQHNEPERPRYQRLMQLVDQTLTLREHRFGNDQICLLISNERFQKAMGIIETQTRNISSYLAQHAPAKSDRYQENVSAYRRQLYQIICDNLQHPAPDNTALAARITQAETPIMNILNIDRHPNLRIFMEYITDALGLLLFGFLNRKHRDKTGDYSFWSRPESATMLRTMQIEVQGVLTDETREDAPVVQRG